MDLTLSVMMYHTAQSDLILLALSTQVEMFFSRFFELDVIPHYMVAVLRSLSTCGFAWKIWLLRHIVVPVV